MLNQTRERAERAEAHGAAADQELTQMREVLGSLQRQNADLASRVESAQRERQAKEAAMHELRRLAEQWQAAAQAQQASAKTAAARLQAAQQRVQVMELTIAALKQELAALRSAPAGIPAPHGAAAAPRPSVQLASPSARVAQPGDGPSAGSPAPFGGSGIGRHGGVLLNSQPAMGQSQPGGSSRPALVPPASPSMAAQSPAPYGSDISLQVRSFDGEHGT